MLLSPSLPLPQKTVYFTIPLQMYMFFEIKKPAMEAIDTLFDPTANRIQKLKALKDLWGAFNAVKGLPDPTIENTWHPNTHKLIELRDWLCERCHLNKTRMNFIKRIMNFVIILYDFDPPWRWIFDSLKDEALKKKWEPRGYQDTWVETYKDWWQEEK